MQTFNFPFFNLLCHSLSSFTQWLYYSYEIVRLISQKNWDKFYHTVRQDVCVFVWSQWKSFPILFYLESLCYSVHVIFFAQINCKIRCTIFMVINIYFIDFAVNARPIPYSFLPWKVSLFPKKIEKSLLFACVFRSNQTVPHNWIHLKEIAK